MRITNMAITKSSVFRLQDIFFRKLIWVSEVNRTRRFRLLAAIACPALEIVCVSSKIFYGFWWCYMNIHETRTKSWIFDIAMSRLRHQAEGCRPISRINKSRARDNLRECFKNNCEIPCFRCHSAKGKYFHPSSFYEGSAFLFSSIITCAICAK